MSQTQQHSITTKEYKNYLTYPYDFFCGQQVRIFFGHVWVDDIITLQYTSNQNKTSIFGYASEQFDAVARGQFIVNGNFTIAFKETGYLNLIHNELKNNRFETGSTKLKTGRKDKDKNELLKYWLGKGKPIEKVLDDLYASDNGERPFENLAEVLEDYIWTDFGKSGSREITRPDKFDYQGKGIDVEGFDIIITFGDYTNDAAEHTVKAINDVHITGESIILTPDGSPIGLNYTFFARGLDEKISNTFRIPTEKKADTSNSDTETDNKLTEGYGKYLIADKIEVTNISDPVYTAIERKLVTIPKSILKFTSNDITYNLAKSNELEDFKKDIIIPKIIEKLNSLNKRSINKLILQIKITTKEETSEVIPVEFKNVGVT